MEGAIHQAVSLFLIRVFAGSFVILAVSVIIAFGYEVQARRRMP